MITGLTGVAQGFMQGQEQARLKLRQDEADRQARESHDLNMQQGQFNLQNAQDRAARQVVEDQQQDTVYGQQQDEFKRRQAYRDAMSGAMTALDNKDYASLANGLESLSANPLTNTSGVKLVISRDKAGQPVLTKGAKGETMLNYTVDGKPMTMDADHLPDVYNHRFNGDAAYASEKAQKAATAKDERDFQQQVSLANINNASAERRALANEQGANYRLGLTLNSREHAKNGGLSKQEIAVIHQAVGPLFGYTKADDSVSAIQGIPDEESFIQRALDAQEALEFNGKRKPMNEMDRRIISNKASKAWQFIHGGQPAASGLPQPKTIDFSQLQRRGQ